MPWVGAMMWGSAVLKDFSRKMEALLTVVNWTGPLSKEQVAAAMRGKALRYGIGFGNE